MSLSPLLKFVYNCGTGQIITRGKKIFHTKGVSILDIDHLLGQARFRIRNDVYQNSYTVTINNYNNPSKLSVRCQCTYNLSEICHHEVAALFFLNENIQNNIFKNENLVYNQSHTTARMRDINLSLLRILAGDTNMNNATALIPSLDIIHAKNGKVIAQINGLDKVYNVVIKLNEDRYFDTSCECEESKFPLCIHKTALFIKLHQDYGASYFKTIQNYDDQKNKLLKLYGYSLSDNLEGKFDFTYENGKPFLKLLDSSIKKISEKNTVIFEEEKSIIETTVDEVKKNTAFVVDTHCNQFPFIKIKIVQGVCDEIQKNFIEPIEVIDFRTYINLDIFNLNEKNWIQTARKLQDDEIVKYLKHILPFYDFNDDYLECVIDSTDKEILDTLWEYILPKWKQIIEKQQPEDLYFIRLPHSNLSHKDIKPISFSKNYFKPEIAIKKVDENYQISLNIVINNESTPIHEFKLLNNILLYHKNEIYCIDSIGHIDIMSYFNANTKTEYNINEWKVFLDEKIAHWHKKINIKFDKALLIEVKDPTLKCRLYISENNEFLNLKPAFLYNNSEAKLGEATQILHIEDEKIIIIHRDVIAETKYCNVIQSLHENMLFSQRDKQFLIQSKFVKTADWFAYFYRKTESEGIEIIGYDNLQQLKISRAKAETNIKITSNINWFEADINITFGDQVATIQDIKKAFYRKENFIKLQNGTIGIIPEDTLQKLHLVTKMGEVEGDKLKVKKIHFSILDELMSNINEDEIQKELEQKKVTLKKIIDNDYSNRDAPEELRGILRPYQTLGFQWLMFLKEAGWGGILADDMGLGKTIQTLSWLSYYKKETLNAQFLVVCPTSLIYNWEKEVQKFTPHLKVFIHHGTKRNSYTSAFEGYDIIISSYGTIRSDIKIFSEITFDYVILDESQAIKNPKSLASKAVLLLNTKYKIALSGTPIQNNTFDLYAQMNFLNPNMLGSHEFFLNQFANPIDKLQEKEAKEQLKKLVYPFILRRTKEQVAKDLPPKTETILYCEMGKEQRKIYEAYRANYQSKILGMIDEKGMQKSQFHILQGLTKLRQICDSPAILNEDEPLENYSIKIDEQIKELTENASGHKTLIFSQFIGMLALLKKALEKEGISYAYFDGSSSINERETNINRFQNDEDCKVFLISLKAGGVGLNLTAADYVYIVDPWWNPAVEQQAIDRTHRIGQTKPVFAYRMICKNTIEEKMLQLQEKKRMLAEDLISDDVAIMKRLTRDDIAFLFS